MPVWPKVAFLAQKTYNSAVFRFVSMSIALKGHSFKNS